MTSADPETPVTPVTSANPVTPGRRRRVQPLPVLWLTLVWVLLWGEVTFANVLGGLLLGLLVVVAFPLPRLGVGGRVRPGAVALLLLRFLGDLVTASAQVAWYALRPAGPPRSSLVVVPLATRDQLVLTLLVEMVSLVPGSIVVELDPDAPSVSLHVLGAQDAASIAAAKDDVLALQARVLRAVGPGAPGARVETEVGS